MFSVADRFSTSITLKARSSAFGTSAGSLLAAALADAVGVFSVLVGLGVLGVLVTFWFVRARLYESVSQLTAEAFVPGGLLAQVGAQAERRN